MEKDFWKGFSLGIFNLVILGLVSLCAKTMIGPCCFALSAELVPGACWFTEAPDQKKSGWSTAIVVIPTVILVGLVLLGLAHKFAT